jgi:hypothetical protein
MAETYSFFVLALGAVLAVAGWFGLLITGFRQRWFWGLANCLPILGWGLFATFHLRRARWPLGMVLVGALLCGLAFAADRALEPVPNDPVVTIGSDRRPHLTLTGWTRHDYEIIRKYPQATVVQMANPDVTDATLEHLRGLADLRELDLNGTQVTDGGLAVLKTLPKLASLRLRGTKITDAGFREHLLPLAHLRDLDLQETAVKSGTAREWKEALKGRQYLK